MDNQDPSPAIPSYDLGEAPWQFADEGTRRLFSRTRETFTNSLGELAEILSASKQVQTLSTSSTR